MCVFIFYTLDIRFFHFAIKFFYICAEFIICQKLCRSYRDINI